MTVDEFLTRHVDGFLLDDLETMAALPVDAARGALGVPMVLTVFAGCELLGGLLAPGNCRTAFVTYWVDRLYPGADRAGADALYRLVRDGVGHAFVATPGLRVTRCRDARHLTYDGDVYIIDALTLHDDFRASYAAVRGEMVERGQPALFELIAWYESVSGELFRHLPAVPDPALATAVTAAPPRASRSPPRPRAPRRSRHSRCSSPPTNRPRRRRSSSIRRWVRWRSRGVSTGLRRDAAGPLAVVRSRHRRHRRARRRRTSKPDVA
jgi:hypothetical protein